MSTLRIVVHDLPAPQGSKRGLVNRHTGRVALVESSRRLPVWREAVKAAALVAAAEGGAFITGGPVAVSITFTMPRPGYHWRTGRNAHLLRDGAAKAPTGKPDLDKLVRSTLDALTAAGVFGDDAQVVELVCSKVYPSTTGEDSLPYPGGVIRVNPWVADEVNADGAA